MGIVRKQSILNLIISYVGVAIGFVNVTKLFTLYFSKEEYGLRVAIGDASLILSLFFSFGINHLIIRYFPKIKDNIGEQKRFLILCFISPLIIFSLTLSAYAPIISKIQSYYQENAPLFSAYSYFVFPLGILMSYFQILCSISITYFKTTFQNFLKDIVLRLAFTVHIILFGQRLISLKEFWIGINLTYVLMISLLLISNSKLFHNITKVKASKGFSELSMKEIILYMLLSLFGPSIAILLSKLDIFMIMKYIPNGEQAIAIYGMAIYLLSICEMPRKAVVSIANPIIASNLNNNLSEVKKTLKKSSINLLLLTGIIFSIILTNLESFYHYIPKGSFYSLGYVPFIILGFGKIYDSISGFVGEIINFSKFYWANFVIATLVFICAIVFNIILIPKYGLNGAAFATLLSVVISKTLRMIIVFWKFKITPFSKNYLSALLISCATIAFAYFFSLSFSSIYLTVFVKTIIISSFFLACLLLFKPSEDIHQLQVVVIKEIKKRLSK